MKTLFTPRRLLALAVLCWLIFGLAHVCGLRASVNLLSGMAGHDFSILSVVLEMAVYLTSYLSAVMLAPILAMAAGLLALTNRLAQKR